MPITAEHRKMIHELREAEVLERINPTLLFSDQEEVIGLITCPDWRQRKSLFEKHSTVMEQCGHRDNIHPFSLNGGALLTSPESPLTVELGEHRVFLKNVRMIREKLRIRRIHSNSHVPCLGAAEFSLNPFEVVYLTLSGKKFLKMCLPDIQVRCFLHVDESEDGIDASKKEVFFLQREKAEAWLREHSENIRFLR